MGKVVAAVALLAMCAFGYYRFAVARLEGARAATRKNCLEGANNEATCDCVVERTWTIWKAREFEDVLRGKIPATPAYMYNKDHAEMSCGAELAPEPRQRVVALLTGQCLDEYRSSFTGTTFPFCFCVAQSVSTPEVVDALSRTDEVEQLVQYARIGRGGLKLTGAVDGCSR